MSELREYKCPCCSGAIAFDSSLQKMKCPFCGAEFEPETLSEYDDALSTQTPEDMDWGDSAGSEWEDGEADSIKVFVCKSCGGEIVADENTAATACPYCGNPVVMTGRLSGMLKPDLVIPFKLDKKAAKAAYEKHISGKRLLPKVFRDQNHIDEIKGVYVPFWLFDCDTYADISYKATIEKEWSDDDYDYKETENYAVFRSGTLGFSGVPADGSSKMPDDLTESLEPFDLSEAVDFKTAYLAGYLADKYDVDAAASEERANERIKTTVEQKFRDTVKGYDTVDSDKVNVKFTSRGARYALYPVWLLNTTWNGNKYTFAMNGQTGKMVGDLPIDKKAKNLWFWGLTAAVTAGFYALLALIWFLR